MRFRKRTRDDTTHPNDPIIPIVTVENQMIADMVTGILRLHHIPCMSRALGLGTAYLGPALQAHDILVLERDRERADEILHAFSDDEDVKLLWR